MADVQSRLSSKGQTVIPKAVREKLGLKTGDLIRFRVTEAGAVTLTKVKPQEDDPFATFSEWTSDEDEALYGRLSRSRSATGHGYCFRVPLRRSSRTTIQVTQQSIQLFSETPKEIVSLRSSSPKGTPLKDAERWELVGEGYPSAIAATEAGKRMRDSLLLALARIRVGVSTGERGPGGFVTEHGLRRIEESSGRPAVNDVPGVTVYREPRPLFVSFQAGGVRGASSDSFREAFEASVKQSKQLGLKEQISLFLYNASFFQPAEEARLLLLTASIEALLDPAPRSTEAQAQIEEFTGKLKRMQLPEAECASLVGTLRWLKSESISQAGQRIARERLRDRTYLDLSADRFFVHVYRMRSKLVHGNLKFPGFADVSKLVGAVELFAADLIVAS